jgi:alpha-galactosidase
MKFGLHFALAEVAPDAPVLADHPDWTATESDGYFGAVSLCLSNKPTRDWLIGEALRMIDEYGVDYLVQDGENMVKRCRRTNHTHDPDDSNYSNAVDGINRVIAEVQRQRPGVVWENCENGGNMMTFQMVQQYVTSTTNDASGALESRAGVWGATYPFSPRYADRYMPEDPSNTYITRSYMFGGPWHFMNQLAEMVPSDAAVAQGEIGAYKNNRSLIKNGQVFHLTNEPGQTPVDAIESYSLKDDRAVVVVSRDGGDDSFPAIRLQGFFEQNSYLVHFQDDSRVLTMSGLQLTEDGVHVNLPAPQSAEIVYVDPLQPRQ